nr:hypothetical protein [Peptoniphilus indolicus]
MIQHEIDHLDGILI